MGPMGRRRSFEELGLDENAARPLDSCGLPVLRRQQGASEHHPRALRRPDSEFADPIAWSRCNRARVASPCFGRESYNPMSQSPTRPPGRAIACLGARIFAKELRPLVAGDVLKDLYCPQDSAPAAVSPAGFLMPAFILSDLRVRTRAAVSRPPTPSPADQ